MSFKRHKQYRLPGYDYASAGAYFITICTHDRQQHFGNIRDGIMHLSPIGTFVEENLSGLESRLLQLDEWEVMPDHIHMVITLHPDDTVNILEEDVAYGGSECAGQPERADYSERATARRVPTGKARGVVKSTSGLRALVPKSLESFVNHFKGRTKRWCKIYGYLEFDWQARFHDRIIRDFKEYERIIAYVQRNIGAWEELYNTAL